MGHSEVQQGDDRIMERIRIILSGLWVSLMLTFLLGDVCSGSG